MRGIPQRSSDCPDSRQARRHGIERIDHRVPCNAQPVSSGFPAVLIQETSERKRQVRATVPETTGEGWGADRAASLRGLDHHGRRNNSCHLLSPFFPARAITSGQRASSGTAMSPRRRILLANRSTKRSVAQRVQRRKAPLSYHTGNTTAVSAEPTGPIPAWRGFPGIETAKTNHAARLSDSLPEGSASFA